MFSSRASW